VLYAAATGEAAVAETLLHEVLASGGLLPYDAYARTVMARLTVTRPVKVKLGVLHGNDAKAYVFFGDRCEGAFIQDATFGRLFAIGTDQLWLIDLCAPLHVDVLLGG